MDEEVWQGEMRMAVDSLHCSSTFKLCFPLGVVFPEGMEVIAALLISTS